MFAWTLLIVNDHPDGTIYSLHAPRASSPVFDWGMTDSNEDENVKDEKEMNDDEVDDQENPACDGIPSLLLESMHVSADLYDIYDI